MMRNTIKHALPTLSLVLGATSAFATGTDTGQAPPAPVAMSSVTCDGAGTSSINLACNAPGPGVFLLSRFAFNFRDGDHKLSKIAVVPPSGTTLPVTFRDYNGDDYYTATVAGTVVNDPRIIVGQTSISGSSEETSNQILGNRPSPDYLFAIRGFQCAYDNGDDHNFGTLKVQYDAVSNTLSMRLRDSNYDDLATCHLQYAWIPRDLGQIKGSGLRTGAGFISASLTEGSLQGRGAFISGFSLSYGNSSDHYVRNLMVGFTNAGVATFQLKDNGSPYFEASINGGILN